jgi:hypothetical protein
LLVRFQFDAQKSSNKRFVIIASLSVKIVVNIELQSILNPGLDFISHPVKASSRFGPALDCAIAC